MRRVRAIILGLIAFGLVGPFLEITTERSTCVLCRRMRTRTIYAVVPIVHEADTECSRWYAAHVEPRHAHVWEWSTCTYSRNLWGEPTSVGCSPGHYPIWLLPPSTQLAVYRHFADPMEARRLFEGLTDARTHDDRLEGDSEDRGHLVVMAMRGWEQAGFPGTWDAWWSRAYGKHVEEHRAYQAWLNADSDMNFQDWQEAKRTGMASPPAPAQGAK